MSDQPSTTSAVVASATQALAIKELGESIEGVKRQIKAVWVAVVVVGLIAVVAAGFTLLPRFFGVGLGGQFRGRSGTFNGQQLNNGTGTGNGGVQQAPQTAPTQ